MKLMRRFMHDKDLKQANSMVYNGEARQSRSKQNTNMARSISTGWG